MRMFFNEVVRLDKEHVQNKRWKPRVGASQSKSAVTAVQLR